MPALQPKNYNITLISNTSQSTQTLLRTSLPSPDEDIYWALLANVQNKLKLPSKKKPSRIFFPGGEEIGEDTTDADALAAFDRLGTDLKLFVSAGEDYAGPKAAAPGSAAGRKPAPTRVVAKQAQVDAEALKELDATAKLQGVELVVGMPDLHAGGRFPIGATCLTSTHIYPALIGSDIGCGMSLLALPLPSRAADPKALAGRLTGLEGNYKWKDEEEGAEEAFWAGLGLGGEEGEEKRAAWGRFASSVGTVGAGNHFLEILQWEEVRDEEAFTAAGLDKDNLVMLVHSGSRGFGQNVLSSVAGDKLSADPTSDATAKYLAAHASALSYAVANRRLIARRALHALNPTADDDLAAEAKVVVDVHHNFVEKKEVDGATWARMTGGAAGGAEPKTVWVHRKGAAPTDQGLVVIPGSRGSLSYLVQPTGKGEHNAWSLAHGAGRQLNRTDAYAKFSGRPPAAAAPHTGPPQHRRRQSTDAGEFRHLANAAAPDADALDDLTGATLTSTGGGSGGAGKRRPTVGAEAYRHLTTTPLGSEVVCEDLAMLFEEAPEAYKAVDGVVADLVDAGACTVVGVMKPLCTYKKRREWAAK